MPHTDTNAPRAKTKAKLKLSSRAFGDGDRIPLRHTAHGEDVSPPLSWGPVPEGTRSLALTCEDPDAPMGMFVHWLAWNIGPEQHELVEGAGGTTGDGLRQGQNGYGAVGYGGPKPPPGPPHRYVFRLFALDAPLSLEEGATRQSFARAIKGHVIGEGRMTGLFSSPR